MLTKEKVKEFIKENCKPLLIGVSGAAPFKKEDRERFRLTYIELFHNFSLSAY